MVRRPVNGGVYKKDRQTKGVFRELGTQGNRGPGTDKGCEVTELGGCSQTRKPGS